MLLRKNASQMRSEARKRTLDPYGSPDEGKTWACVHVMHRYFDVSEPHHWRAYFHLLLSLKCTLIDCASLSKPRFIAGSSAQFMYCSASGGGGGGGPRILSSPRRIKNIRYIGPHHTLHAVHSTNTCDPFNSTREVSDDPF
jgi:hypothetical protein